MPEVSKNNSNCASPASSVVKTSANKFAVSFPLAAVYKKSIVPDAEISPPTNDLDVETLSALEYAISEFSGSAMVISHDRFFLNRICTHILAFEGNSNVEWFEGDYDSYIQDKKRRLGEEAVNPKRTKYRKFLV